MRNKTNENLARFKVYKNRLIFIMRLAKKKYYQDLIAKNSGDSKRTWQVLKEAIGIDNNKSCQIKQIAVGAKTTSEPTEIANHLNGYFSTIGSTLDSSLPSSQLDPTSFVHFNSPDTCFLAPVSPEDIITIICELKNKGNGTEPISNLVLKGLAPSISAPLAHLVNICLSTGVFPDDLKTALITPVFKAGNKQDPGNYRPISVISPLSKIIEKCVSQQILSYLQQHNILSDSQFGFRTKHSTEHALLNFIDFVTKEKDDGKYVLGIYLDIKKAFDSVNHQILFKKLEKYGIRGLPLKLLKSYLSNRRQQVKLENGQGVKFISSERPVLCGVPQGSVLGPLLFLIYVNDLKNASREFHAITFADDTNLFLSGSNLDQLCIKVNEELQKVHHWFICNRLCLNVSKTSYQLYTNKTLYSKPHVRIDGASVDRVKVVRFLGMMVDEDLTFKDHIDYVCQKFSIAVGFMHRGKGIFEKSQLVSLYNALALPHLNYCSMVGAINYPTPLNRVFRLQKRAARVILGLAYCDPVSHRFHEIGLKTLADLRDLKSMLLVYKIKHGIAPHQVRGLIDWINLDDSLPNLRNRGPLVIQFARTVYRQHTYRIYGAKLFNSLNALSPINLNVPISKFKKVVNEQLALLRWN